MEHILVVDDQKEVHEEIEGMLTRFGYERSHIEHAYDFQSAKNHLDNAAPDILLLDIVMPNEDGFSVVDYINKRKQKTHTIIMTAYPQLDYALKAIKSKVDAFLVKPFTELELQATLHDIIDSSQDQEEKKARSQSSHLYIR